MDEFDLVCFQYTQCLRCLDIDQCTHGVYKGYNEKNEFCNASEYGCENNLCKCQKKLIQGTWYILLFNFMPHLGSHDYLTVHTINRPTKCPSF